MNACGEGLGAVLSRSTEGHDHVIAYASRMFIIQNENTCESRHEMLALVSAIPHFRPYLYGK